MYITKDLQFSFCPTSFDLDSYQINMNTELVNSLGT